MINFCTLFDSNYLTRGLAMHKSLLEHCNDFHLYIFAFDEFALDILNKMALSNVTVISLSEFEDDELLKIKPYRSKAEYCWTCTPSTIGFVIKNYKVDSCTYIDADLFFYSNPKVLIDEMGDKSVLITEHRYTKPNRRTEIAGKYCVQFITFKNNTDGLKVLIWWKNACIDWCYDRYEDGKFGDQKYLDDWTNRFNGVHVLQHLGGGMAPWNIQQYSFVEKNINALFFIEHKKQNKFVAIFYHYHYVRFYNNDLVDFGWFSLSKTIINKLYIEYILQLEEAFKTICKIEPNFKESLRPFSIWDSRGLKNKLKVLFKLIFKYNLYKKQELKNKFHG